MYQPTGASAAGEQFDVVVVGGGPGGSTVATLTVTEGRRVLLLERESFPRYQIGESLLPATVHGICQLLGVGEEVERAGFTRKRGGTFRWGAEREPWNFLFAFSPELAGPTSFAYQVPRADFDQILLDNARRAGVEVRERCQVLEVIADHERVRGVRYRDAEGADHEVLATYVVDASGNRSPLYRHAGGERRYSEFFRNRALFGYFRGGQRLPEPDAGNILCADFDEGWFWYIPLSPELTSVGAVVHADSSELREPDRERLLLSLIDRCDIVRDFLAEATRVTEGMYGEIRIRKDYSYTNDSFWRPGMALVGDAACFIDPVFSTGVHLATYSGLLAARSINSVLAGVIDEELAFAEFEGRYKREYRVFTEFLASFYDMNAATDSYFWRARKVAGLSMGDAEGFATLVAGIASGEAALTGTDEARRRFSRSSEDLAAAVSATGAMQTPSGERMHALFGTPVVREVMTEMNQVQAHGTRGKWPGAEGPLLPGGLVASEDGRHWAVAKG